jgi:death on curing protein
MIFVLLPVEMVELIHDSVLDPGEFAGRAPGKSLEGALARVENRVTYGLIEDEFDLAAAYAAAISQGHCFVDGNKRTAFQVMDVCLDLSSVDMNWDGEEIGAQIIKIAQGEIDASDLSRWLKERFARPSGDSG